MAMPYAYIQSASDGQAWLFIGDEPLVPIHRRIGQTICDRINADRDALLLARFAYIEPPTEQLTGRDQLTADTPQTTTTQSDAKPAETAH